MLCCAGMALHAALGSLSLGAGCQQPVVRNGFSLLVDHKCGCVFDNPAFFFVAVHRFKWQNTL